MKYKKTILDNGLRVITIPMPTNPTATVLVLVEAGSAYESKENNGISHFLEHLCFKGTEKRPTAFDITKELDGLGAQSNAFTGEELTGYYAKVERGHVLQILDIIADLYVSPVLDQKEIEKEKGVIIDEISMYEDMPMHQVRQLFYRTFYGDQPAGWGIAGEKKNIKKMTRKDITAYRGKHYVASATTVVIAGGGWNETKIVHEIEKRFAAIPSGAKGKKKRTAGRKGGPIVTVKYKETDQTHLILGVKTYDLYHKNDIVLDVIAGILGKGMSSRLFQKLRDEMGVGYYVRASNDALTDHGHFLVSTGVNNGRVEEVVVAIMAELKRMTIEKVEEKELVKVKDFISGNLMLGLESSDSLAEYYGAQEILHKPIEDPYEYMNKLQKVTAKEVMDLSKKIFTDETLTLALIGPFKSGTPFKKVLTFGA